MRRAPILAVLGGLLLLGFGPPGLSGPPGLNGGSSKVSKAAKVVTLNSLQPPSSGGVAPNPYSTLVYDLNTFFLGARGGVADTDGSMWTGAVNGLCTGSGTPFACCTGTDTGTCTGGSAVADATSDWIPSGTLQIAAAGGTKYQRAVTVANAADTTFCRDSVTFLPCSTGATCTSTLTLGAQMMVFCPTAAPGLCEPQYVQAYTGCNGSGEIIESTVPAFGEGAGTMQLWANDGLHGGSNFYLMAAQALVTWPKEMFYRPPVNGIPQGHNAVGNSCAGWSKNGAASAPSNIGSATRPSGFSNGILKASCSYVPAGSGIGNAMLAPTMAVTPGQVIVMMGPARYNDIGSGTLTTTIVDAANTTTPFTTQDTYQISGAVVTKLTSQTTSGSRRCYGGCYFVTFAVVPAGVTGARMAIYDSLGSIAIVADNLIGFPKEEQNMSFNTLFPSSVLEALRFETDSRGVGSTLLVEQFDAMIAAGIVRPDLKTEFLAKPYSTSINGRRAEYLVCNAASPDPTLCTASTSDDGNYENYRTIDNARLAGLTPFHLGVNDLAQGATVSTIASRIHAIAKRIRQNGSRPMWIGEPPYRADTTQQNDSLGCLSDGSANCGVLMQDLMEEIQFTHPEYLHQ